MAAQSSSLTGMPPMVLDHFAACQTVAFCGVFPEIGRAWATVDARLYLWRYDRWWVLASLQLWVGLGVPAARLAAPRCSVSPSLPSRRRACPWLG